MGHGLPWDSRQEGGHLDLEDTVTRTRLVHDLADLIAMVDRSHPVRVAIDGVDAAGKTMLADELVQLLEDRGRAVLRASIDGFHRTRDERYRRGLDSPEGYYYDSFDYEALRSLLLLPLGPGGSRNYQRACFDFRSNEPVEEPPRHAPLDSVLLFDGVFLLRPELEDCWDYRVFLAVDFEETVRRASMRDQPLFGSESAALQRYWTRYVPGQKLYLKEAQPQERADVIVENTDISHPRLLVRNYPRPREEMALEGMA